VLVLSAIDLARHPAALRKDFLAITRPAPELFT